MTTHLIIPDPHAHPDFNNNRFTWLGKLIVDIKPDVVICMGDWADMPSLCSYDEGTSGFEGRRYTHDIWHALDAQERMFEPIRKAKKRLPRFIMHEGNHEHRIKRAIELNASSLDGIISINDLKYDVFGWEFIQYNGATPAINVVDGIAYAHYHSSGIMGRPISGIHPAYQLLAKQYMSSTQGHIHTTDYCVRTTAQGRMIHGLIAGVYQDWQASFAGVANDMWWKGVIVKRGVHRGSYDPQWIGLNTIRNSYS